MGDHPEPGYAPRESAALELRKKCFASGQAVEVRCAPSAERERCALMLAYVGPCFCPAYLQK